MQIFKYIDIFKHKDVGIWISEYICIETLKKRNRNKCKRKRGEHRVRKINKLGMRRSNVKKERKKEIVVRMFAKYAPAKRMNRKRHRWYWRWRWHRHRCRNNRVGENKWIWDFGKTSIAKFFFPIKSHIIKSFCQRVIITKEFSQKTEFMITGGKPFIPNRSLRRLFSWLSP